MSDLIDRQAAIANAISGRTREVDGEKWIRVSEVRESIKTLPSAEPVRRGKWKQTYLDHEAFGERPSIFYCSACCACSNVKTNYCPNCGTRMDAK